MYYLCFCLAGCKTGGAISDKLIGLIRDIKKMSLFVKKKSHMRLTFTKATVFCSVSNIYGSGTHWVD